MPSLIQDITDKEDTTKGKAKQNLKGYISVDINKEKAKHKIPLIEGTNQPDILAMQDMREKQLKQEETKWKQK